MQIIDIDSIDDERVATYKVDPLENVDDIPF